MTSQDQQEQELLKEILSLAHFSKPSPRRSRSFYHSSSHSNGHKNHSSSHTSHSNHFNHSNGHQSHSNHSSHGNHNNDVHTNTFETAVNSYSAGFSGTHSQSAVQVASKLTSEKIGTKGGTGVLAELKGYIATARNGGLATASNSEYDKEFAVLSSAEINNLLKSSYTKSDARYYNGTIRARATVDVNGTTASIDKTISNTDMNTNDSISWSPTLTAPPSDGAATAGKQSYSFNANVSPQGRANSVLNTDAGTVTMPRGTKITKAQMEELLTKIKKVSVNTISSFGTLYYGRKSDDSAASWKISHSNHSSHSNGHKNHGSSHQSHGNHGNHSSGHSSHANHSSHSDGFCSQHLKKNIKDINFSALDLINKLNLIEFNYTEEAYRERSDNDPTIKHYGFIAEDTPEEFSTYKHDRMDYTNCIGLLLKAIQELDKKINK